MMSLQDKKKHEIRVFGSERTIWGPFWFHSKIWNLLKRSPPWCKPHSILGGLDTDMMIQYDTGGISRQCNALALRARDALARNKIAKNAQKCASPDKNVQKWAKSDKQQKNYENAKLAKKCKNDTKFEKLPWNLHRNCQLQNTSQIQKKCKKSKKVSKNWFNHEKMCQTKEKIQKRKKNAQKMWQNAQKNMKKCTKIARKCTPPPCGSRPTRFVTSDQSCPLTKKRNTKCHPINSRFVVWEITSRARAGAGQRYGGGAGGWAGGSCGDTERRICN